MTTAQTRTTLTADGVDFIDKDDTWRCFRLFEHITDTGRTHTTNISTKSEPEMVKNGTFASPAIAFASNVLPGTRRPHHQNTFRNFTAEFLETARLTQILHPARRLLFGLITTGPSAKVVLI